MSEPSVPSRGSGNNPRGRSASGGYMDISIVFWIGLALLALVAFTLYERLTGQSPIGFFRSLWRSMPEERASFLVRTVILLILVPVAAMIAAFARGDALETRRSAGKIVLRSPGAGGRTLGAGLGVVGMYMVGAGVIGPGPYWWLAFALGLVLSGLGVLIVGTGNQVVVEVDRVVRQSTLFGKVSQARECELDPSEPVDVTMETHRTGGAFGQPMAYHHDVLVAGQRLHTVTLESEAEALSAAVSDAISLLRNGDVDPAHADASDAQ